LRRFRRVDSQLSSIAIVGGRVNSVEGKNTMGIGETGAVNGAKPQAQADKNSSAGSVKDFNEALGQSASSTQAAATTGGKPTIVRIDATHRSKSATATLSDGSKVPLALTKNQLAPGDTLHNLEYGAESGPQDSPVVELSCDSGASCSILWQQPANYGLSPKVIVSIKQDPDEAARQSLGRLPSYIRDYVKQAGGENLESQAKMGEELVKSGAKKEDFAPIEMQGKAPADPDFTFVESARKGRWSQFPSFAEFKKDLERKTEAAQAEARTKGLNPPDPFAGAEWKDNPAGAKEKWDKFVHAEYDKALKNEAAGLRYVGEYASMAENAIYQAWGLSAAVGTGAAGLAVAGEALAIPTLLQTSTGVSAATWFGLYGTYTLGTSFGQNLIDRTKEGIAAGSDPISIISTAATDTVGGKAIEKVTNKSNLTRKDLNLTTEERVMGGILNVVDGGFNILGLRQYVKAPGGVEPSVPPRTSANSAVNDAPTSTQKQLSAGASSADDVAANAAKARATAGGNTASTVKTPVGNDAPATNVAKGQTGEVTAPGTAKSAKASSGGDAGDTMRMRKPGSREGSRPSDTTNVSGSKTGETARDIPDAGDTVKMRKVDAADAPKAEAGVSGAAGAKAGAGAGPAVPTKSVDQVVDAYTQGRTPAEIRSSVSEGDIARMKERFRGELQNNKQDPGLADQISDTQYRRMAMAEDIYGHYNQPSIGKPQTKISQAQLDAQLKKYDGPTESPDGWHVRMNKSPPGTTPDHSWVKADAAHPVDRFYVNVKGDHAAEFADHVAGELNKKGIKFQLKVASEVDGYARADSALVYTQGKDFDAVRDVVSKYRDSHPAAIADGSPAFTKPMGKGISVAEEPLQEGLPLVYHGGHSFGTARANVIAEAINQAPANASPPQVKAYVNAKLQQAGFDVDRPWLSQGSKVDRFNVGDANVARSSAPNSGAALADTVPQPAVRANPQSPPPGQGGPGGHQGASGGAAGGGSNGSGGTGASSADIVDQAAARQHAEQVRNYKPNFKANPNQGESVAIDSLLDDMQKGKLKVVDNAFNRKFHDQVWHDLTGKQGQAPVAYTIGDQARVDLNRLTPEQLRNYRAYVQKQDAAKGPH
jgi:hypothetical protein